MQPKIKPAQTSIASSIPAQKPAPTIPSFDRLPDSAFIRESQLVQSTKRPETPAPLPFSAPTLWRKVKAGTFPFIGNGKAIALGEPEGLIKTVFDAKTGELLGAHMIGAEVTELIQGYVVGRALETTEEDLMNTVFPHPTLSEMMHESVLDAYGRALHI